MNREVLAMGEVGLSAGCEQQWVDALTTLLSDADLCQRMGAAGRVVVEERFSLQRLVRAGPSGVLVVRGAMRRRVQWRCDGHFAQLEWTRRPAARI